MLLAFRHLGHVDDQDQNFSMDYVIQLFFGLDFFNFFVGCFCYSQITILRHLTALIDLSYSAPYVFIF